MLLAVFMLVFGIELFQAVPNLWEFPVYRDFMISRGIRITDGKTWNVDVLADLDEIITIIFYSC